MINATTFGGGGGEAAFLVPLIKDWDPPDWWVFEGSLEFYQVTKVLHNRLQGQEEHDPQEVRYSIIQRANAATMANWDYDLVVVHDPQPALIHYRQTWENKMDLALSHRHLHPNGMLGFFCQYIGI